MSSTTISETLASTINAGKEFKNLPSTFAFSRLSVVTDALMYSGIEHDGQMEQKPLHVIRHKILGTKNSDDPRNPQSIESAKLDPEARHLIVQFSIKMTPLEQGLHSLMSKGARNATAIAKDRELRAALDAFYQGCLDSDAIEQVMYRYARNILNGRWLWRNRALAADIIVKATSVEGLDVQARALEVPMNHFNDFSEAERELARALAQGLRGESLAPIQVTAQLDMGFSGAVEVFPSQCFTLVQAKKVEDDVNVSRMLYYVGASEPLNMNDPRLYEASQRMGQAAIRDAKVGNALRTIDDWYPGFEEFKRIIAIEPMGANLTEGFLFRTGEDASAFSLMKRVHLIEPTSDQGLFLLGCLIRGGVFSGSESKNSAKKDKEESAEEAVE